MGERVIHVMTHDSIGLGEDGPTHQPVEHLAALRAIPNLLVFRPCDAVETVECWQLALQNARRPERARAYAPEPAAAAARIRRRQPLRRRRLRDRAGRERIAEVSLFATGSEVAIAVEARKLLRERGVAARVVSVPCFELFRALPAAERQKVIGNAPGQGRGRGRDTARLGRDHRLGRRFCRHDLRSARARRPRNSTSISGSRRRRSPRRR